jgi:hypothetical protein
LLLSNEYERWSSEHKMTVDCRNTLLDFSILEG